MVQAPRHKLLSSTSILSSRAQELPQPHYSIFRQLYASLSTLFTTCLLQLIFPPCASNPSCFPLSRHGLLRRERALSHCSSSCPPPLTSIAHNYAQVLRYTALVAGIGYGYYHQKSIVAKAKAAHRDREFEKQASLIAKAKAEWAKKTMPKEVKEGARE